MNYSPDNFAPCDRVKGVSSARKTGKCAVLVINAK